MPHSLINTGTYNPFLGFPPSAKAADYKVCLFHLLPLGVYDQHASQIRRMFHTTLFGLYYPHNRDAILLDFFLV